MSERIRVRANQQQPALHVEVSRLIEETRRNERETTLLALRRTVAAVSYREEDTDRRERFYTPMKDRDAGRYRDDVLAAIDRAIEEPNA